MRSVPRKRKVLSFEEKFAIVNAVSTGEKKKDVATQFQQLPVDDIECERQHPQDSGVEHGCREEKTEEVNVRRSGQGCLHLISGHTGTQRTRKWHNYAAESEDTACILGHDDFKASNGWLQGFKSRNCVVGRVISGESASADSDASASWVAKSCLTSLDRYEAADLYDADETALFHQMLPNHTWSSKGTIVEAASRANYGSQPFFVQAVMAATKGYH
ncbi:hypothetical protein HPB51_002873 [Rhipicephalus microplus]|uniref:HTH CENPB-type domain-containing protein n=1 Tax=Rhipicephalus microplus TaxID=6941 RepID=A0A9J6EWR6_RHIMP|nr:hypothetical protein HPB51_002873 [Rhipicephalus microplus]